MIGSDFLPDYYRNYVLKVNQLEEPVNILFDEQEVETKEFVLSLKHEDLSWRYADGKWNMLEMLQHIIDVEQVFQYRYLRALRDKKAEIKGFNHDKWVHDLQGLDLPHLFSLYAAVRSVSKVLFLQEADNVYCEIDGNKLSANYIPYILLGHEKHHVTFMRGIYENK